MYCSMPQGGVERPNIEKIEPSSHRDGFKHILGRYPGIKAKFNNYLNKHETDVVWRAKAQSEQVREFTTAFLDGFDDPGVRAKEAVERALRFRQKKHMTTGTYLELKELRFDEALREGNTPGHVETRIRDEPERCRNAVERSSTCCLRSRWQFATISLMSVLSSFCRW